MRINLRNAKDYIRWMGWNWIMEHKNVLLLLLSHSVISDSPATPWTVAPGSSVHGIPQARILE